MKKQLNRCVGTFNNLFPCKNPPKPSTGNITTPHLNETCMLGLGAAVPMALVPATTSIMLYRKSAENQQGE
jgi:hypothetical protein